MLMQVDQLHASKRALDKLLQHKQDEFVDVHSRLSVAMVSACLGAAFMLGFAGSMLHGSILQIAAHLGHALHCCGPALVKCTVSLCNHQ